MAKRRRPPPRVTWYAWILGLGAVAVYLGSSGHRGSWGLGLLAVALWGVYQLFFCPTTCNAETKKGEPCDRDAHGRLRACGSQRHRDIKRDALVGALTGRRSPFARYRTTWARDRGEEGWTVQPPTGSQQTREAPALGLYNLLMLALTAVSTLAGVVVMIATVLG